MHFALKIVHLVYMCEKNERYYYYMHALINLFTVILIRHMLSHNMAGFSHIRSDNIILYCAAYGATII